jgi:hypothetical protein
MHRYNTLRVARRGTRLSVYIAAVLASFATHADNFVAAHYDGRTDELVVTMRYRGTNPNHAFTLQWGECKQTGGDLHLRQTTTATVLDDQWNDTAHAPFKKTVRFSLAGVSCRPAEVTLQTAPRYRYTINIPGAPTQPR